MDDQSETTPTAASQSVTASDTSPPEVKATPETLTAIIKLLEPLPSEQRQRTVAAAMMFLGEAALQKPRQQETSGGSTEHNDGEVDAGYSSQITKWMNQNDVSAEELDQVFHFTEDGTFELLHAPGNSKKVQTQNTYILTGLGKYLSTDDRTFDDATARAFCEKIGCFDKSNHSTYLKNRPEFTGDKSKGYSLTNPGIRRGAALVKEVAGGLT